MITKIHISFCMDYNELFNFFVLITNQIEDQKRYKIFVRIIVFEQPPFNLIRGCLKLFLDKAEKFWFSEMVFLLEEHSF